MFQKAGISKKFIEKNYLKKFVKFVKQLVKVLVICRKFVKIFCQNLRQKLRQKKLSKKIVKKNRQKNCSNSFNTLSVEKNRHFLTPSPRHLVSTQLLTSPLYTTMEFKKKCSLYHFQLNHGLDVLCYRKRLKMTQAAVRLHSTKCLGRKTFGLLPFQTMQPKPL